MAYLNWDTKITSDFSPEAVGALYDAGYVFTRVGRGVMNKTRSFRVNLSEFLPSSENRRVSRKSEYLTLSARTLPLKTGEYSWEIGKLAKDFYDAHGADFSANKVKELLTSETEGNFNLLLTYTDTRTGMPVGHAICYLDSGIFHYSYPFYVTDPSEPSRGLGMMLKAIDWAKTQANEGAGVKYAYLGSLQRPSDTYKLQFRGGEWFDGERWRVDAEELKQIIK